MTTKTYMNPKQYLSRIKHITHRIESVESEIMELRDQLFSIGVGSAPDTLVRVQTSRAQDKTADLIAEICKREDWLLDIRSDLFRERTVILDEIRKLDNPKHVLILQERYVHGHSWDEIREHLGYKDLRWVYRLHGSALVEFANRFPEKFQKNLKKQPLDH